jgi:hypothetical protein
MRAGISQNRLWFRVENKLHRIETAVSHTMEAVLSQRSLKERHQAGWQSDYHGGQPGNTEEARAWCVDPG